MLKDQLNTEKGKQNKYTVYSFLSQHTRKIKEIHVDSSPRSRSGFTSVPLHSVWMSCWDSSGSLRKPASLTDPLNFQLRLIKRSQVQWKNPHVITTRGRYGVSHYCQESVPAANSSANTPIALLYGVKWCKNFLTELAFFWLSGSGHFCYYLQRIIVSLH